MSRAFPEYFSTGDAALADEVLDREVASLINRSRSNCGLAVASSPANEMLQVEDRARLARSVDSVRRSGCPTEHAGDQPIAASRSRSTGASFR